MPNLHNHGNPLSAVITIDARTAFLAPNTRFRGLGMISANNSSRLLLDYKAEYPERYRLLLQLLFGKDALHLSHLKLEMGADINSSSGTEPAVKRSERETVDVTRGAGYQLAADAKAINPDLTLDMLWWGEPRWVSDASDCYAARYRWYKETLCGAYETYGLKFDYVSANRNEREVDTDWIIYLSEHLKTETDCPYDFSSIKIVAADEICTWQTAEEMLKNPALMQAVNVVGSHYTSHSNEHVRTLAAQYDKEIWFSEGCAPMSYSQGTYRFDQSGSGLSDINGFLDIANRIIAMFPCGGMTLYEFQPAVAAYYDGVNYCHKQLITANTPWSGHFIIDNGYYMALHFTRFIKKGWTFIQSGGFSDAQVGGDGHALVNAVYSYVTAADLHTGDYSTIIANTTSDPIDYTFSLLHMPDPSRSITVWESNKDGYLQKVQTLRPIGQADGSYTYTVTIRPYTLATVSTLVSDGVDQTLLAAAGDTDQLLKLPYTDNFRYADYPADYLARRGGAPRYMTDEGGAFEVVTGKDGQPVLMQQITVDTKAQEWGETPDPVTNFGDDRWFNYSASVRVLFDKNTRPAETYAGIGLRYNLASKGESGWWLQLFADGSWRLNKHQETVTGGKLCKNGISETSAISAAVLTLLAIENTVRAYINDKLICEYRGDEEHTAMPAAGRAALYSSYHQNAFTDLKLEPAAGVPVYIRRYDDTDDAFTYEGDWTHQTMDSFCQYRRTLSTGHSGAKAHLTFFGSGFTLTGPVADTKSVIQVTIDGQVIEEHYALPATISRESFYHCHSLSKGMHTVTLSVLEGMLSLDSAEISE